MVVKPKGLMGAHRMGIYLNQTERGRGSWREPHNGGGAGAGRESFNSQRQGGKGDKGDKIPQGILTSPSGPRLQSQEKVFHGE